MTKLREFKPEDYETIMTWMKTRSLAAFPQSYLPQKGWIVPDLASIHLMDTDTSVALIELFVSNPKASQEEKLKACDELIQAAFAEAMNRKKQAVMGYTKIPKVMGLGMRYGFVYDPEPYYFFRKTLGENANGHRRIGG